MSTPDYHPTPLEDAYTSYLLEAVFDLDPKVPEIKISGREAVTFLSKSAVHRLILRNLWTTVDPQSAGALLHRHQLSTLLRCVALAQYPRQDSFLNQALQSAYHEQKSPVEAIRACLVATAQQTDIPLASFEGIPVPDRTTLKPYMKGGEQEEEEEEEETETDDFGNFAAASAQPQQGFDAFNGLSGNNAAAAGGGGMAPNMSPQQQGMGQTMGMMQQPQQLSMGMMQQQQPPPPHSSMGMMNQQQQPQMGMMNQQQQQPLAATGPQTSDWGAFDNLASAPSQPQQPQLSMQSPSNDFGGFTGATRVPPAQQQAPASSGWGALDVLASTTPAPMAMSASPPQAQTGEMGAFDSAAVQSDGLAAPAATQSGWDALDALAASTPAPPPPTLPDASPPTNDQPQTGSMPSDLTNNPQSEAIPNGTGADEFGSFGSSSQPSSALQSSGWDALDALASSTPAPAPPTLGSGSEVPTPPIETAQQTNDDFGDFASSTVQQQPPPQQFASSGMGAADSLATGATPVSSMPVATQQQPANDFGGFGSLQQPDTQQQSAPAAQGTSGWDAFDALTSAAPAPPPILPDPSSMASPPMVETRTETTTPVVDDNHDDDDFGDFESKAVEQQQPVSGWDALDALAGPVDAPLPSLPDPSAAAAEPSPSAPVNGAAGEAPTSADHDDDDFGDFASTGQGNVGPSTDSAVSTSGSSGPLNGDAFAPSTESNMVAQTETAGEAASGWDALDALAAPPVPAPSLSGNVSENAAGDFGDFASSTAQPAFSDKTAGLSAGAPPPPGVATVDDDDDEFGDFESTPVSSQHKIVTEIPPVTGNTSNDGGISMPSVEEPLQPRQGSETTQPIPGKLERSTSLSPPPEERSGIPSIPKGKAMNAVRSDSAFYSARASSMGQSDASSLDNFVDAVETTDEMDKVGQAPESNGPAAESDDPFAAFETLAPSQPELPPLSSFESQESIPAHSIGVGEGDATGTDIPSVEPSQPVPPMEQGAADADDFDDFGDFEGVAPETSPPENDSANAPSGAQASQDEQDFGEFATVGSQKNGVEAMQQETEMDLFGDFSAPPVQEKQPETNADMFGDFSAPRNAQTAPEASSTNQSATRVDMFGDFSAQQTAQTAPSSGSGDMFDAFAGAAQDDFGEFTAPAGAAQETAAAPEDEFGNFGSAPSAAPVQDDFGDFAAPAKSAPAQETAVAPEEDFGDFTATANAAPVEDDFGGFAASAQSGNVDEEFGDFGDFGGAEPPASSTDEMPDANKLSADSKETQSTGSFDNFGDFDAVPTHNALSDDSGDEWDAFQEASQKEKQTPQKNDPETENLLKIREVILAATTHVPESLLQCTTGGHVDFASCFEANIGVEIPVSLDRKKRMQRCLQVATLLSAERSKLASAYWTAAMSTAKEELTLGLNLCTEAKAMKKKERESVVGPLETYVHGLGEIVRVVRMVVATIGDLLMLDPSSLFTVDTLASSWCSLAILKDALEIERLWKSISEEATRLGIKSKDATPYKLSSISELRAVSSVTTLASEFLCQFTLQPFVDDGCKTTNQVEWGERCFMACAANFLANKCTFFSYDD